MDSMKPGLIAGTNNVGPATVHGAIGTAAQVANRLWEAVSLAEKVAEALDGPMPAPSTGANAATPGPACMADYLAQTVNELHSPTSRLLEALGRIERRIG